MTGITYSQKIYVPTTKVNTDVRIFGDFLTAPLSSFVTLATCSGGSLLIGVSSYATSMTIENLVFDIPNVGSRTDFRFDFLLTSARERFYSTSLLVFDFGFLAA